ncbi:MAG: aldo/keto reductase [Hyphomicrobiaceae bacterium]
MHVFTGPYGIVSLGEIGMLVMGTKTHRRARSWRKTPNFFGQISRRNICIGGGVALLAGLCNPSRLTAEVDDIIMRAIPSTGEALPLVGLGSWITFNVGQEATLLERCAAVVRAFFAGGGQLIDCSPMYGSSQATIGYALSKLGEPATLFSAEKVWTSARGEGQIERSRAHWNVPGFDLIQVHNLVGWQSQLALLREMKADGRLRYIGITTSHGLRHDEVARILEKHRVDFVQLTYNAIDRKIERRLLPLAQDQGVAVIANRPYRQGQLLRHVERQPLPEWAKEVGASSWAQFLLKFVISHPGIACAIPATTRVDHVEENLKCATGVLPDLRLRERMANYVGRI